MNCHYLNSTAEVKHTYLFENPVRGLAHLGGLSRGKRGYAPCRYVALLLLLLLLL
jgi:hypothetical protein